MVTCQAPARRWSSCNLLIHASVRAIMLSVVTACNVSTIYDEILV